MLRAAGMRPLWFTSSPDEPATPPTQRDDGVETRSRIPEIETLPSSRCHILDFSPSAGFCEQWKVLLDVSISCTLACTPHALPRACAAHELLRGGSTVRRICDLHPHLVLELLALLISKRVDVAPWIERISWEQLPARFAALEDAAESGPDRWPVFCPG